MACCNSALSGFGATTKLIWQESNAAAQSGIRKDTSLACKQMQLQLSKERRGTCLTGVSVSDVLFSLGVVGCGACMHPYMADLQAV